MLANASGGAFDFGTLVGSGQQLRSIPLSATNSISITFNQAVSVSSGDLTLINLDGTAPSVATFSYDADSQTATWTFASSLSDGRYLVRLADTIQNSGDMALDGEFTNPWSLTDTNTSVFASGDGVSGSEFRFRFTVLAGDSDHDNVDGTTDYRNWQSYEPGMIHVSTTTDEYDSDLSFGDVSLREAVNFANNATEPTTIDLPAGTYNLTISGTEGTGTAENDLDVAGDVTILGAGPGLTVITNSLALNDYTQVREFQVTGSTDRLKLEGMTLTGAYQYSSNAGTAALVQNGATLEVDDCAIDNNLAYNSGVAIRSIGGNVTILRSVFTGNTDYTDGVVYASDTTSYTCSLTIGQSIFALNTKWSSIAGSTRNVKATSAVVKTNLGDNLYDDAAGGFFDVLPGTGDYLGTVNYVVTTVADTFNHADDNEFLSIREAVDLANTTSGTQEIWIPAWKFTLTRDRGTATADTDVSIGDLDISYSVTIRGVNDKTSIAWKADVTDRVFDLLGDYTHDGSVDSADYVMWANENGLTGSIEEFPADGNDDGVVDSTDYSVWSGHYGNTFDLHDIAVSELVA